MMSNVKDKIKPPSIFRRTKLMKENTYNPGMQSIFYIISAET